MRKYLAAAALGAILIAGQAAASDGDGLIAADAMGSQGPSSDGQQGVYLTPILLAGGLLAGLLGYALSQGAGNNGGSSSGAPASP